MTVSSVKNYVIRLNFNNVFSELFLEQKLSLYIMGYSTCEFVVAL